MGLNFEQYEVGEFFDEMWTAPRRFDRITSNC